MSEMAAQRSALAAARRLRAQHLIDVAEGVLDPFDVIRVAQHADQQALRVLTLQDLFSTAKQAPVSWTAVKKRLLSSLDLPPTMRDAKLTVGWLLDPRAGGRRWYALHDALRSRDEPPWDQFVWLSARNDLHVCHLA